MGRELIVKVWYPSIGASTDAELVWEELRGDARTPWAIRLLLKLSRARTSTHVGAAFDTRASIGSIVVYNHGLISFASENASLLEHLSSRGHVALALRHVEQLAELRWLTRGRTRAERKADAESARRLQAAPRPEKARLAVEYFARSTNTNRIVIERARDTAFVLDRFAEILRHVPGVGGMSPEPREAHLVGFSVGGAVSNEVAARDSRAKSVVNLDGGMYGTQPSPPIRQPYLMMYSSANDGGNDALLPDHAVRHAPAGTLHLNYHDVSALLPLLRYAGATGTVNAREFLGLRNRIVEAFIAGSPHADVRGEELRAAKGTL
jgi:dienelactone hydrolase